MHARPTLAVALNDAKPTCQPASLVLCQTRRHTGFHHCLQQRKDCRNEGPIECGYDVHIMHSPQATATANTTQAYIQVFVVSMLPNTKTRTA